MPAFVMHGQNIFQSSANSFFVVSLFCVFSLEKDHLVWFLSR